MENLNDKETITEILYEKNSKYQNVVVANVDEDDTCLFLDGEIQLCKSFESHYHEFMVHFPATYVPHFENVLIIGGGDCMILREVMKYKSVKNVTMVEIDKYVIDVSKKYFDVRDFSSDPRVNIVIGDASIEIDNIQDDFYDLIIIDTTEDGITNSSVDTHLFYNKCQTKLAQSTNSVIVKNGNMLYDKIKSTFKYARRYHIQYNPNVPSSFYDFIIASDNLNIKKIKPTNPPSDINSTLKHYKFDKHQGYFNK
jgi:spermidine synthase